MLVRVDSTSTHLLGVTNLNLQYSTRYACGFSQNLTLGLYHRYFFLSRIELENQHEKFSVLCPYMRTMTSAVLVGNTNYTCPHPKSEAPAAVHLSTQSWLALAPINSCSMGT